jgi:hypothetical protein
LNPKVATPEKEKEKKPDKVEPPVASTRTVEKVSAQPEVSSKVVHFPSGNPEGKDAPSNSPSEKKRERGRPRKDSNTPPSSPRKPKSSTPSATPETKGKTNWTLIAAFAVVVGIVGLGIIYVMRSRSADRQIHQTTAVSQPSSPIFE